MSRKKGSQTTIAHFSISGEFVTQHARGRMVERGWEDALRFLHENIIGIDYTLCMAILQGEKRLVGVNNLDLADELPDQRKDHIDNLSWYYNGTVFDGTRYLRPYAYVDNWGRRDLPMDGRLGFLVKVPGYDQPERSRTVRSEHYMDNSKDVAQVLNYNGAEVVVLWKAAASVPPFWRRFTTLDWQRALDDYLLKCSIEHRGHQQWYPPDDDDNVVDATTIKQVPVVKEDEPYVPPAPPEPITEFKDKLGWMLPDGRFYPCEYHGHINLADSLWHHVFNEDKGNPEYEAEQAGWIKFARTLALPKIDIDAQWYIFHMVDGPVTAEQYAATKKWCDANGEEFPYWLEDKRPKQGKSMFGFPGKKPRKDKS